MSATVLMFTAPQGADVLARLRANAQVGEDGLTPESRRHAQRQLLVGLAKGMLEGSGPVEPQVIENLVDQYLSGAQYV